MGPRAAGRTAQYLAAAIVADDARASDERRRELGRQRDSIAALRA